MTWTLMQVDLPSAGESSKPLDYKESTKNEALFENIGFNGNQFEDFRKKRKKKKFLDLSKTPSGLHGPRCNYWQTPEDYI